MSAYTVDRSVIQTLNFRLLIPASRMSLCDCKLVILAGYTCWLYLLVIFAGYSCWLYSLWLYYTDWQRTEFFEALWRLACDSVAFYPQSSTISRILIKMNYVFVPFSGVSLSLCAPRYRATLSVSLTLAVSMHLR